MSRSDDDPVALRAELELARADARRMRDVLDALPSLVAFLDREHRYVFLNRAYEAWFGIRRDDWVGRPIVDLVGPGPFAIALPYLDAALAGQRCGFEAAMPHGTGVRHVEVSYLPQVDASGAVAGVVSTIHDAGPRIAAREEEQARNSLAEASRALASSLDLDHTLTSLARIAVPSLADWAAIDMVEGDRVRRVGVAHVDSARVELAREYDRRWPVVLGSPYGVGRVLRTGEAELTPRITDEMLDGAISDRDQVGMLKRLGLRSSIIVPLRAEGRVVGAVTLAAAESGRTFGDWDLWLAEDLARRASSAVQNALLYRAAQDASRSRDEFLATISHELRTPLTAILGWARLLVTAKSPAPTQVARGLAVIERNARAQAQLIEDLLDVSRVISGKLHLARVPVDVNLVVEAALESASPAAQSRGVEVETALDPALPKLMGDPDRLQQVVWNLLSNAVKFTGAGGRVRVETRARDGLVEVRVTDTGRGMKPEFLPFVFERFRQADARTTREYGGLGLGLAIVRHLVELHGGTVTAASPGEGLGSTFTVHLPSRAPAAAGADRPTPAQRIENASDLDVSRPLEGQRVLVVDDEPDARELVTVLLEAAGAVVATAATAAAALEAAFTFAPTAIVSDLGMPGGDGYSFIGLLRQRGSRAPAIALSAYAHREDRARALEAGFLAHVAKPIDPAELVQALVHAVAIGPA